MNIGFSKDIHKLQKNKSKPLILGGITIFDSKFSIVAHSDGDIILHSITSAILGALGLKTLGEYFSDNDIMNKSRTSVDFVKYGVELLKKQKKKIVSIDLCIICEKIILKNYLDEIKDNLYKILGLNKKVNIGIKATRFEKKRCKYIECYCSMIIK